MSDSASACAVDDAGNVYVAGTANVSTGSPPTSDVLLVKYSPAGAELWAVETDVAAGPDGASACAIAPSGDVYVAAFAFHAPGYGLTLMK